MSDNFQSPSLLGTSNSLQLSLPVVSTAAPLTGSVCDFSRASAPAVSSAWLLPSASSTSAQPLMESAYLYQHPSTTTLSGVSGQSQISNASASYPSMFEWDIPADAEKKSSSLKDLTVTVIDQDTAISSMPMAAQYSNVSDTNAMVPLYPSLSASLVPGTPNQGPSLSLPYQEGSQVYYYDQGTLGSLISGELGPCLQSYGSVSYTGSRASVPQPEMVMVLKEVQATNAPPPASTPGIYYSMSAQPITDTSFQVMETTLGMESSLTLQPPSQAFCLPQTSEFPTSCNSRNIQILESHPELEDMPIITQIESPSNLLALPPAPSQEQTETKDLDEIKGELPKSLAAYQITIENQEPPLLPLEIPDIHQLLACIDPLNQGEQPGLENAALEENSLSLEDQGALGNGFESSNGFADLTALVEDIHLPQLFSSLKDLDQSQGPNDTNAIKVNQVQDGSSVIKGSSDQVRKNKCKASEPLPGTPKAKVQAKSPEGAVVGCNTEASDGASGDPIKHLNSKPQKATPNKSSKSKVHGQEKVKRNRENNAKKTEDGKQPGTKVKAEEKPTISKLKRKKNQPELSQETFKKPRSCLGLHMLESVQVFHALGKKSDTKTGIASSRALGSSSNTKDPQPPPAVKLWLGAPEKAQVKVQNPESIAEKPCSSPALYELPPPGKVKLVPLPFPTLDKPQVRPIPRKPQALAPQRPCPPAPCPLAPCPPAPCPPAPCPPVPCPPDPCPLQSASTNTAQPTAVNTPQLVPVNASCPGPAKSARPTLTNPARPGLTKPVRPSVSQACALRPASSCISLPWEQVPTTVVKAKSPPKPPHQFLLQDFGFQPIPWRKPNVPEPVMSSPITKEQRPEREALKKQAQQERQKAAKYTSLGRLQFFIEREKDMEMARYYGYTI